MHDTCIVLIYLLQVMGMLPPDTPVQDICKFLTAVLGKNMIHKRKNHFLRCLLLVDVLLFNKNLKN